MFALLTIGYMIWARNYLSPLSAGEIVQFEVAKTVSKAQSIIQEWKNTGKYEQGIKSTSLAYLFIILYTLAIGLGCRFISACTGNEILAKGGYKAAATGTVKDRLDELVNKVEEVLAKEQKVLSHELGAIYSEIKDAVSA